MPRLISGLRNLLIPNSRSNYCLLRLALLEPRLLHRRFSAIPALIEPFSTSFDLAFFNGLSQLYFSLWENIRKINLRKVLPRPNGAGVRDLRDCILENFSYSPPPFWKTRYGNRHTASTPTLFPTEYSTPSIRLPNRSRATVLLLSSSFVMVRSPENGFRLFYRNISEHS